MSKEAKQYFLSIEEAGKGFKTVCLVLSRGPVSEKTAIEKLESNKVFNSKEEVLEELSSQFNKYFFPKE